MTISWYISKWHKLYRFLCCSLLEKKTTFYDFFQLFSPFEMKETTCTMSSIRLLIFELNPKKIITKKEQQKKKLLKKNWIINHMQNIINFPKNIFLSWFYKFYYLNKNYIFKKKINRIHFQLLLTSFIIWKNNTWKMSFSFIYCSFLVSF